MNIKASEIAKITKGKLKGEADNMVEGIIIDSRLVNYDSNTAFVAIRGKNHDGHDYVPALYKKGIRTFIVNRSKGKLTGFVGASFIEVADTVQALQLIARNIRMKFKSPVIGVTGSAGKTVVKEWLADVLALNRPVIRSPKSYNSQVGVPLSLMKLDNRYGVAIIEAGISLPGEMEKLERMVEPDIGVITNIGDAHAENFTDMRQKAVEKLKLFTNSLMLVYRSDYKIIDEEAKRMFRKGSKVIVDWSTTDPGATMYVIIRSKSAHTHLRIEFRDNVYSFRIPFTDKASVENAVTVTAVSLAMNIPRETIEKGLASLVSVAMRMEIKNGINNCQIIEDFYNSDPGSFGIALELLKASGGARRKTLILSDFLQSGREEISMYGEVARQVSKSHVHKFIGIGPALSSNSALFSGEARFFATTDEFISGTDFSEFRDEVILLKGARKFEFEKIGRLLEHQAYQTILEVNLDAVAHNLNQFRSLLAPETRVMVMVKAFAYGAGAAEVASFLEYHGVSYLGVANTDEGVELREAGLSLPIIVMNPDPVSMGTMIRYNLEPVLFGLDSYEAFLSVASKHGLLRYPVHLEIDSGMHRLGFMPGEVDKLAVLLAGEETVKVASVFSHFAASEDPAMDGYTDKQARIFTEAADKIAVAVGYPFIRHICNSAGISRFPRYHFDMVRPGIGIYGAGRYDNLDMKTVGRFKTNISQIKDIPAGEPVGYNCRDVSDADRTIAILPVGYADGLNRKLGNRNGEVFVAGTRVPIIGNVCMDACMVDITGTGAKTGDVVEIFGENISIDELASKCGTIPYEILTSIHYRVKRVFYRE